MKFSQIAVSVALTALSVAASATTFTKSAYHFGDTVKVTLNSVEKMANTAEIIGTFDPAPAGSFAAFCVELDQTFISGFTGVFISPTQASALSTLITGAGWKSNAWQTDAIASDDKASITTLQLGIWDIVYDGSIDLGDGKFTVVDATARAAYEATLDGWMSAGTTDIKGDLLQFTDGHTNRPGDAQDILIAVPEPSTYALMIAGLGAIGFVARRRAHRG